MHFLDVIGGWINRHFSNEEAIYLVVLLLVVFLLLVTLGGVLAPVLTGLVVAFLLDGLVKRLTGYGLPETFSIYLVFLLFLGAMVALILFLVPLVWQQLRALIIGLPGGFEQVRALLMNFAESSPEFVPPPRSISGFRVSPPRSPISAAPCSTRCSTTSPT